VQRAPEGNHRISSQKQYATDRDHRDQGRRLCNQRAEPSDAERDQGRIRRGTDQAEHEDMLPQQPLPQDKGILGADGDDQGCAEQEAGQRCGEDGHEG